MRVKDTPKQPLRGVHKRYMAYTPLSGERNHMLENAINDSVKNNRMEFEK